MSQSKPKIITLCGSTRFPEAFEIANMHLTMMGYIVISVSMFGHSDRPAGAQHLCCDGDEANAAKQHLDAMHRRKIDASDGIYVVNVAGYIGSSTAREIAYAEECGKSVDYMFPGEDYPDLGPWCNEARAILREMVSWFAEHDGKAWDFGEFTFVKRAKRLMGI